MVTQKQLKEHALNLKNVIYVWGANFEIITKELVDKLYKNYGNSTYNKDYYEKKLKEGKGKFGADCSGTLKPISGYDTTAHGYYEKCTKKGRIASIPRDKVLLVFKENSSGRKNHVGIYTGDGYVSELASSKLNYQRKPLDGNGWDDWGYPDFVDYDAIELLDVDGSFGKDTVTKSQYVFGTKQDGIVSHQSEKSKDRLINCSKKAWEFDDTRKGSSLIRAIQKFLTDLKYYKDDIDGLCGKNTIMAIQQFLTDRAFYHGGINGKMDEETVKGWQKFINKRL